MASFVRPRNIFDRVPRELLWDAMLRRRVSQNFCPLFKPFIIKKNEFVVDGAGQVIEPVVGVRQVDFLGPYLFIFFM